MPYVATINTPGYLPMDDEPPIFETAREAWDWLAEQRRQSEEELPTEGYTTTALDLAVLGETAGAGLGTVYGDTPATEGFRTSPARLTRRWPSGRTRRPRGPCAGMPVRAAA